MTGRGTVVAMLVPALLGLVALFILAWKEATQGKGELNSRT